ncbi:MAG: DNA repair protein RadC [Parvibaculum sp.]|jgi:DNA repair protein RadC|uniref:RadC family protein n=1 Tax=Parvibaculum sp. TaxID=2024848 RepID=UPI0028464513|nr:DNA repair protein RadC [Parvibaculum sp.]MDR3499206.1 DNA repair protein RadC [Parvibaculum sp.]
MLEKPKPASEAKPSHAGHRERLRSRFLAAPDAVPDYELLELLLFRTIPRRDVKPLAKELIRLFGTFGEVLSAEPHRLQEIKGVSEATVADFHIVREAGLRLSKAKVMKREVISSWTALLDYCSASMAYNPVEQFRILFLDRQNVLIADEVQQRGTIDHTPVYPREVIKRALALNASSIILVHNHPSGDPTPSSADIEMTKRIVDTAKPLGIQVHDHLVIGKGRHASFKSLGLI